MSRPARSANKSLLPYQRAWIRETAPLAVTRNPAAASPAYHAVMHAADDRGDIYYQLTGT